MKFLALMALLIKKPDRPGTAISTGAELNTRILKTPRDALVFIEMTFVYQIYAICLAMVHPLPKFFKFVEHSLGWSRQFTTYFKRI